jgi:hypothetical protein
MRRFTTHLILIVIAVLAFNGHCWSKCFGDQCPEWIAPSQVGGTPVSPPCHHKQQKQPPGHSNTCELARLVADRVPAAAQVDFAAMLPVFLASAVAAADRMQAKATPLPSEFQSSPPLPPLNHSTVIRI